MGNAVVTLSIGAAHRVIGNLTMPLMKRYARRIGAGFEVITTERLNLGAPHYEKFQLYDLLDRYDRILFLDDDVVVRPEAPDLYALVHEEAFGAFLVHPYLDLHDPSIIAIQARLGSIGWDREYFNSGVMVVGRRHRDVFLLATEHALGPEFFYEQTQINYNVQKLRIRLHDIGFRFNHTTAPNRSEERFESFFIHYPGRGHRRGSKTKQILLDLIDLGLVSEVGHASALQACWSIVANRARNLVRHGR